MKTIIFHLLLVGSLLAKPQAPYTLSLNKDKIQPIPLHQGVDTLLIFPEEVEAVLGNGLVSKAEMEGSVFYQQGQINPRTVILHHLDAVSKVLMTVMIADTAYVFRLEPSTEPASVIYFLRPGAKPKGKKITRVEALLRNRPISKDRKSELLRLARESKFLKDKIPQEYKGYSEKEVSYFQSKDGLKTTLTHVSRFPGDKAIVLRGTILNQSNQTVNLQNYLGKIIVGKSRFISPAKLRTNKRILAPHQTAGFEALVIGQAFSLENEFKLQLTKTR